MVGASLARGLVLALVLGCVAQARAQPEPLEVSADIEQAELDARLAALDAYLADVQRPTRAYWGTWLGVLSALAVTQGTLAFFQEEPADRARFSVGATLSGIGALAIVFAPAPGRHASVRFRRMPQNTRAEQLEKLAAGERWLFRESQVTRRSTAWWVHAIGVGVGLGLTLGLGLGYEDNWLNAVGAGVGAIGMVEVRIWTRTRRAIRFERRYRASPAAAPRLALLPTGFSLRF